MNSVRVLLNGTLKYMGALDGGGVVEWLSAGVFVLDYHAPYGGGDGDVTVVAREPIYLAHHPIPSPVGSIHTLPVYDREMGELLTVEPTSSP